MVKGVPLPQLSVVLKLLVITFDGILAPVQAVEEIHITIARNGIHANMGSTRKASEVRNFHLRTANGLRYRGY